jgi:hypothetical protein
MWSWATTALAAYLATTLGVELVTKLFVYNTARTLYMGASFVPITAKRTIGL